MAREKILYRKEYRAGKCYNCKTMKNVSVMKTERCRLYNKCPNCPSLPKESLDESDYPTYSAPHRRYDV